MQTFNLPAPGCPFTNLFPESAFSHGTLSLQEVLATFPVHGCYKYLNFPLYDYQIYNYYLILIAKRPIVNSLKTESFKVGGLFAFPRRFQKLKFSFG